MSKATTVEKNGRFYIRENKEILTENELLKEWLESANKQIEQLENIRKEAIKYIKTHWSTDNPTLFKNNVWDILNKGE